MDSAARSAFHAKNANFKFKIKPLGGTVPSSGESL
jgi:hypothetical protein